MPDKEEMMAPQVSILIPVFNGSDYLSAAIDSALAQTYKNIEIIVVNDGSTDEGETERIACSYGSKIRYFSKPNGGVSSALNLGIREMRGHFFSWLSHDDLYAPMKIASQIDYLRSLPTEYQQRTVVYSDYSVFRHNPSTASPVRMRGVAPEQFRFWLTLENCLHGCSLLIPRSAFDEVGGFDEHLKTTQDYDLWFRMAKAFQFRHISVILVHARSHAKQGSVTMSSLALDEGNKLLSGFISDLSADELYSSENQPLAIAYASASASMFYRGFRKAGRRAAYLSFKCFSHSSWGSILQSLRMISFGFLANVLVRPVRRFVPADMRQALKRWFRARRSSVLPSPSSLQGLNLRERFAKIYADNMFKGAESRSGAGSDLAQTAIVREALPVLLKQLRVDSVLDAPCGDWFWMREVDLPVSKYIGVDIVSSMILKNQTLYGTGKIEFRCINLAEEVAPKVDLIFSRDCLVHLSFADIHRIISHFKQSGSKYLLTTTFSALEVNEDLGDGFWRPLNMQQAPFNFPEPLRLINECCSEDGSKYSDKCLGLWLLADIRSYLAHE